MAYRCPACNRTILSRRNKLCSFCREPLPAELLFTPGVIPKYGHAALCLACFFVDGCVKSSFSLSSAFNSARHSSGVQCQFVRRSLAIAA